MTAQTAIDFEQRAADGERDALETLRSGYLTLIRAEMRRRARDGGTVTPDDARAYFETLDPPDELSRNFLGCVFRGKEWQFVGTYKSKTPNSHANRLNMYRLAA